MPFVRPLPRHLRDLRVRRVLAFLVDRVIAVAVLAGGTAADAALGDADLPRLGRLVLFTAFLVAVAYAWTRDGWGKPSVGRRLLGLRVVREDGRELGLVDALKREVLLHFAPLAFVELGLLIDRKPRLGERWSRTRVVDALGEQSPVADSRRARTARPRAEWAQRPARARTG